MRRGSPVGQAPGLRRPLRPPCWAKACHGQFMLLAALFAAAPARVAAQEEQPTFKAEVKVVNVLATVRDRRGAFIRDLGKDEFSVLENGRPQTIRYFSRETDLPLTLGLMIDTSLSQKRVMEAERMASYSFLEHVLREKKDQVFIMQFDLSPILRQELTSSFLKLSEALERVDVPSMNDLRSQTGGGTMLYDAHVESVQGNHATADRPQSAHRAHGRRGYRQRGEHRGRDRGRPAGRHAHLFDPVLR